MSNLPNKINLQLKIDMDYFLKEPGSTQHPDEIIAWHKKTCFKKNPYIFQFEINHLIEETKEKRLVLLRTHKYNYVLVNQPLLLLLDYFDGGTNLGSLFEGLPRGELRFLVYDAVDHNGSDYFTLKREEFHITHHHSFADFIPLIKKLYYSRLLEPTGINSQQVNLVIDLVSGRTKPVGERTDKVVPAHDNSFELNKQTHGKIKSPVLLLGDTGGGTSTVGLLYLASYLRRHHIEAYCQWNDLNLTITTLRKNTRELLLKIRPKVVGLSMKWFPHIARVLEICRIVKEFNPDIEVVVGGNTASFFYKDVIRNPWVDYVIRGDGEVPILKICQGKKPDKIPNCISQKGAQIIETPITYIQDKKNSMDIYLSHLDRIFVSRKDLLATERLFIFTGKGCSYNCFYCAGCKEAQARTFNRPTPFMRGASEVQKDLREAMPYTSTFLFDFDSPLYNSIEYYQKIWEGIDLSHHFCEFYFWHLPTSEFLELLTGVFKHVYIGIDLCSFSERHRMELSAMEMEIVKPQPTDEELLSFFQACSTYENIEVEICLVAGLPYFTLDDIEESKRVLARIIEIFPRVYLAWGRLHSQPGAPIVENVETYGLKPSAKTFDEFLYYSQLNLEDKKYPGLRKIHYPHIYSNDQTLDAKITNYYLQTERELKKHHNNLHRQLNIRRTITKHTLMRYVNEILRVLRENDIDMKPIINTEGMIEPQAFINTINQSYSGLEPIKEILFSMADLGIEERSKEKELVIARNYHQDEEEFEF